MKQQSTSLFQEMIDKPKFTRNNRQAKKTLKEENITLSDQVVAPNIGSSSSGIFDTFFNTEHKKPEVISQNIESQTQSNPIIKQIVIDQPTPLKAATQSLKMLLEESDQHKPVSRQITNDKTNSIERQNQNFEADIHPQIKQQISQFQIKVDSFQKQMQDLAKGNQDIHASCQLNDRNNVQLDKSIKNLHMQLQKLYSNQYYDFCNKKIAVLEQQNQFLNMKMIQIEQTLSRFGWK